MTIKYEYQIVKVDEANKYMEIRFTSEGKRPHNVGARLPFEGEDLDALVHRYAPLGRWTQEETKTVTPSVGAKGGFDPDAIPAKTTEQIKAEVKAERQRRMALAADPIYFQWQRGEATEQEWLDAVEAIRASLPYPDEA